MSIKCLSCRGVQTVTEWLRGWFSHRLLIEGSSGLSCTLLQFNSHLHPISDQVSLTVSCWLFEPSVRLFFRLFHALTWLGGQSHICHAMGVSGMCSPWWRWRGWQQLGHQQKSSVGSVLTRTALQTWMLGPSINVWLNRVIAGSLGGI